jgi:MFS transporter, ACS family, D-galactonate transporter
LLTSKRLGDEMMDNSLTKENQLLPNLSHQKPTRVRFMVCFLLFLATAINYLDRTNMAVAAPAIKGELGFDAATLGLLFSGFSWSYALMQLPGGWFLDRFGSRVTYTVSCGLWSLFTLLMGFGRSVAVLFGLRLAVGFSEAPAFPTNSRVAASWFPKQERATVTSIYTAGEYVGLAFLTPVLFWLSSTFGWSSIFWITGIVGILFSLVWYSYYRDPQNSNSVNEAELEYIRQGDGLADKTVTGAKINWKDLGELFKHRQLWGIYIGQFATNSTLIFFLTWFPTYLVAEKHMPMLKAGIYASIPYAAAFLGVLVGGYWSDTMLKKGYSLSIARKLPIITGGLGCCTIVLANYSNDFNTIIAIMSVAFFAQGMAALGWVIVGDVAPSKLVGLAGGVFNFFANLSGIITPIVIGFIVQSTGSFTGALIFMSCVALAGACSYIFLVGKINRIELKPVKE